VISFCADSLSMCKIENLFISLDGPTTSLLDVRLRDLTYPTLRDKFGEVIWISRSAAALNFPSFSFSWKNGEKVPCFDSPPYYLFDKVMVPSTRLVTFLSSKFLPLILWQEVVDDEELFNDLVIQHIDVSIYREFKVTFL
jgi:hypothetical protein